jgi:hypothetical protein
MEEHAGCPKCASFDLTRANGHKDTVAHRNGFVTFRDLRVGEELFLPEKWFDPAFADDNLYPPAYFASLPYADGVTPSPFGEMAPVILSHFRALDDAAEQVRDLDERDGVEFLSCAPRTAAEIIAAASPAFSSENADAGWHAQYAKDVADWAIKGAQALSADLALRSPEHFAGMRAEIQDALESALYSARLALQAMYGSLQPPTPTKGNHP